MERKRHIFTTIWLYFIIGLHGIFFFKEVLSAPISSISILIGGFFYVMLLFWYKWAFWGIILFRLLSISGLLNFIPFEDSATTFEGSYLSTVLINIVFLLILFAVLKIKNKEINKSTWEQLRYRIRTNAT